MARGTATTRFLILQLLQGAPSLRYNVPLLENGHSVLVLLAQVTAVIRTIGNLDPYCMMSMVSPQTWGLFSFLSFFLFLKHGGLLQNE